VGPSNSGTGNLGSIPSGTKVLLGFNEPNHGARPAVRGLPRALLHARWPVLGRALAGARTRAGRC